MHKTHSISTSSLAERRFGHIICAFMPVTQTLFAVLTTESSSSLPLLPLSPTTFASSSPLHPLEDWNQENKKHYQIEPSFGDYGTWNPTPRSGGPFSAPVPHEEKSCCTRLFVSKDKRHVKHWSSEQLFDTNDMSAGFVSNARGVSHVSLTQTVAIYAF